MLSDGEQAGAHNKLLGRKNLPRVCLHCCRPTGSRVRHNFEWQQRLLDQFRERCIICRLAQKALRPGERLSLSLLGMNADLRPPFAIALALHGRKIEDRLKLTEVGRCLRSLSCQKRAPREDTLRIAHAEQGCLFAEEALPVHEGDLSGGLALARFVQHNRDRAAAGLHKADPYRLSCVQRPQIHGLGRLPYRQLEQQER